MHAVKLLHKKLTIACPAIHAKRLRTLLIATQGLLNSQRLSLTRIGRALPGTAYVKHNIKRIDRLLGNVWLHHERQGIYAALMAILLKNQTQPVILVDWSDLGTPGDEQLLRASIPIGGRAVTLYEEVHPLLKLDNPNVHDAFLKKLKALLPKSCRPIVISDAGFRNTWFKSVTRLGWDWVGRIRNRTLYQPTHGHHWLACKALYENAKTKATYLGEVLLAKSNPVQCHFYLIRKNKKARDYHVTSTNRRVKSAQREREPWLLASSIANDVQTPNKIVAYYKTRMQIEEAFRDAKSIRYGLCLRQSKTTQIERLQILLLIAALATLCLLLVGQAIQTKGQQYRFQANTTKHRIVLSTFSLGCIAMLNRHLLPSISEIYQALTSLQLRMEVKLHE
jgi:hypothetical protein